MTLVTGSIELPEEIQSLKTATADFVNRRILPIEAEICYTGEVPEDVQNELRELGYYGLIIPPEFGGLGLNHLGFCAVHEELARAPKAIWNPFNLTNGVASHFLMRFASDDQKARWLPEIAAGRIMPSIAVSEPEAGSDVQNLRTRAERTANGWLINGNKHYITFGARADLLFVLARTGDKSLGSKAFSLFLVEKGTPGLRVARLQENMAGKPVEQAELLFEDMLLPPEALIGGEGNGLECVFKTFAEERLTMATTGLGTAQRAIELGVEHAKTRKTFGSTLSEYQAIQHLLADSATELFAARAMTFEIARQLDHRPVTPAEAGMVKLFAAEMAGRVVDRVVQIFGGAGYMAESPICQMYREVRVLRISGGTSEIQRNVIAKSLLGQ